MSYAKCSGPLFEGTAERAAARAVTQIRDDVATRGEHLAEMNFAASIRHGDGKFEHEVTDTSVSKAYQRGRYTMPIVVSPSETVVTTDNAMYGPWLEGTGSRNRTTRFKGYSGFRRASQTLALEAADIAEEAIRPYLKEMNGA